MAFFLFSETLTVLHAKMADNLESVLSSSLSTTQSVINFTYHAFFATQFQFQTEKNLLCHVSKLNFGLFTVLYLSVFVILNMVHRQGKGRIDGSEFIV
jgi:hypothetical protein